MVIERLKCPYRVICPGKQEHEYLKDCTCTDLVTGLIESQREFGSPIDRKTFTRE